MAILVLALVLGKVQALPQPAPSAAASRRCFDAHVLVTDFTHARPGIPISLRVRSEAGLILTEGRTNTAGEATLHVCWSVNDRPLQIEAMFPLGEHNFARTIASFRKSDGFLPHLSPECLPFGLRRDLGLGTSSRLKRCRLTRGCSGRACARR
jgi:hypothetical protein